MEIVAPEFEILTPLDPPGILARLERAGRICYRSEGRATEGSSGPFVRALIHRGHHSVIEHENLSLRLVCDRGVSHELVRHRLASFSQESTRYVNYGRQGPGLVVVRPLFFEENSEKYTLWLKAMKAAEAAYLALIEVGATAQEARSVLPHSLKTEIIITANMRQWRHILALRSSPAAHPQMREIMSLILARFQEILPEIFDFGPG